MTHFPSCNTTAVQTHKLSNNAICQSKECSKATGLCASQEAAAPAEDEKKGKKKKKKDKTEGSVDSVDDGAAADAVPATVASLNFTQPLAPHAQGY